MTDLFVRQETTVDDQANVERLSETSIMIIMPTPEQGVKCTLCLENSRNLIFIDLKNFVIHCQNEHLIDEIKWKCGRCERLWPGLHNWQCHFPKCKGEVRQVKSHKCEKCEESFDTKIGLSMHERHMHPSLRNHKRQMVHERERLPAGTKATVWTVEKTALLVELNSKYKHLKQPNAEIIKYLPNKSMKQISDQRRRLQPERGVTTIVDNNEIIGSDSSSNEESPELSRPESDTDTLNSTFRNIKE